MKIYRVSLLGAAQDWFETCRDSKLKQRIATVIDALAEHPRPPGCAKLSGTRLTWRVRVGDHRVLYDVQDDRLVVLVIRIAHRREAYR